MNIFVDANVKTVSDSTILQSLKFAKTKSLKAIVVANPSINVDSDIFGEECTYTNIFEIPPVFDGVILLKGVFTRPLNLNGLLDIKGSVLKNLHVVTCGLDLDTASQASFEDNTQCIINSIKNPYVDVICGLESCLFYYDIESLVIAAKKYDKMVEINNAGLLSQHFDHHKFCALLNQCKARMVKMVVSSGATNHNEIGCFDEALALVKSLDLPEKLVMNTDAEKFVRFLNTKKRIWGIEEIVQHWN